MQKTVGKWNYQTQKYDDYSFPEDWNIILYTSDMEEEVNCCQCGKLIKFGDGYTSKEIHTSVGFGYPVCADCYIQERKREIEYHD